MILRFSLNVEAHTSLFLLRCLKTRSARVVYGVDEGVWAKPAICTSTMLTCQAFDKYVFAHLFRLFGLIFFYRFHVE